MGAHGSHEATPPASRSVGSSADLPLALKGIAGGKEIQFDGKFLVSDQEKSHVELPKHIFKRPSHKKQGTSSPASSGSAADPLAALMSGLSSGGKVKLSL
eukprot:TRINITY_DN23769_c0_g1_i1.p1 TRINITY_DN23769_c0_g1~~TRINITY_DN23769_c0_g1_i1.p1  ORF type:complete len:112 (+),score=12.99 TRINITY_DN23769_c0_g1_i1:37-336(+)